MPTNRVIGRRVSMAEKNEYTSPDMAAWMMEEYEGFSREGEEPKFYCDVDVVFQSFEGRASFCFNYEKGDKRSIADARKRLDKLSKLLGEVEDHLLDAEEEASK